ncbi:MAG: N,N'-diacetylchitobiose phosphorylase [Eubacteriales bacterium]|nr:N,N'-diacetylchitobiose phosphorylase [Eubacteriales bacterium]MDD3198170.1 N,N'-diacetylchitobiose phosphorylase [Eubacteriales bacterium]MDD4682801.1 N,N'-diacetylchitobiose phosphorylase [Eubacteriales bacterium]
MRYGYFDNENREYVINDVALPVSWTNYIGTGDMCGVFNHTAGGYIFYKSPEYHRITRFRPNGVPMDGPGHYVYIRDNEDGDYWSVSWQPVGKPLDQASYTCRHGLSYSRYQCEYKGVFAEQNLFVAVDDPVEIWDVKLKNTSDKTRNLSLFSYLEFSFHQIDMDNRNFQMSLYASGSDYKDGIIEYDLYYEENGWQFFTSNFEPDGFDCVRDSFVGSYRTERNPIVVETGRCTNSVEKGGNHCGGLMKQLTIEPGQEIRLIFLLGEGDASAGRVMRSKYASAQAVDAQFAKLHELWDKKISRLQVNTPNDGLNTHINIWNLYQSEINVMFSRFSSFIEVGGRTGLGYRDTAQDAMTIVHSNPQKCRSRIIELLQALTSRGYGLHLFDPAWFHPEEKQSFRSPTVIPTPSAAQIVHGLEDACSDDALWLVGAITVYLKETGDYSLLNMRMPYADQFFSPERNLSDKHDTVYDKLKTILDFSAEMIGDHGICQGLRADWNDCLNLGGGESAMVSFLHCWALRHFIELAEYLGNETDVIRYTEILASVEDTCGRVLWDGSWYTRGITADGRAIGSDRNDEGKLHLESNAWAILSGAADEDRAHTALESVVDKLSTEYGLMLNWPPYTVPDDGVGFVTRVYPGVKENGAIFSHPNPWVWAAAAQIGEGDIAMKLYDSLCPYHQNDKIEIRQSEPYSYCQFVMGPAHTAYGRARHPFMTGTAGWAYYAATQYMLGIRPGYNQLYIDPCIPAGWQSFSAVRVWRGCRYEIQVENPEGIQKGVQAIYIDGKPADCVPELSPGSVCSVRVVMGRK